MSFFFYESFESFTQERKELSAMTDTQDNIQDVQTTGQESAGTEKPDNVQRRINEVIAQKNAALAKLAEIEAKQQEREAQSLAEQGKYKELYEAKLLELETMRGVDEKASRYQSALESSNQARLQRIPEDKRSLIPEYDDPVKLGEWLDRNASLISEAAKPTAPNLNGAAGGGGSARESASSVSPAVQDLIEIARNNGYSVNPERVAQFAKTPIKQSNTGE